jgi:C4-type Zn-finger protein
MPRYFFDIQDGDHFTPDYEGMELDGLEAAKAEAKKALPDIVKDEMPDGDRRDFTVVVKDEVGHEVLQVKLSLVVESLS